MQSLYWVLTWACHRRCKHCYDDRFRPYVRDALTEVVGEGQRAYQAIIKNLPDDLSWYNPETDQNEPTQIILAGGELLIDGVRDELFFPVMEALKAKYKGKIPHIGIQTTGDILTEAILQDCLAAGVTSFGIASIDDYHVGMKGEKKFRFMEDIRAMMARHGVTEISLGGEKDERLNIPKGSPDKKPTGSTFVFFGAQPDLWIGELWPRGRAFANGLSNAGYETNFCARWSGGLNFLKLGQAGSEISIEPNGNIYPCCLKTAAPIGNLTEERLSDIFDDIADIPAIQAINKGMPERMGQSFGFNEAAFEEVSAQEDGKGRLVKNKCLGCDVIFIKHLREVLETRRLKRQSARDSQTLATL
jgi:MoaA/NifB/PqqE/SkfB family radical SAM enzyme